MLENFLLWSVSFTFSLTFHEAAHAWVAKKGGDLTAYASGQVSLNPLPHMKREPFGMILVPLISFFLQGGNWMIGWASAPYDPYWADRHPRRAAVMALAGPVSNLLLFVVCAGIFNLVPLFMGIVPTDVLAILGKLMLIMCLLNLVLAVFNFIPLPPLDGAEIILLFFPENRAHEIRARIQSIGFFGLLIAWYVFPYIFRPILNFMFALFGLR